MTSINNAAKQQAIFSILPENSTVNDRGTLEIGGVAVDELAQNYGTPLYILDEAGLRHQARQLVDGLRARWQNSEVLFASKSLPAVAMYRLAHEEGLAIDVAGGGELKMALAAGVSPEKIFFHGNAKSDAEIQLALDSSVGTIIVDNHDEIARLQRLITQRTNNGPGQHTPQDVLLRIIPGVEANTHASMATGGNRSKFGLPLDQAAQAIDTMQADQNLNFRGIHLHIGSQILDAEQFAEAVRNIRSVGEFETYDVGGGLGVKYTYDEVAPIIDEYLDAIVGAAQEVLPADARLLIEPGRSLVARSGVTLYSVLVTKKTGMDFVAVDGGLADFLESAMTGQRMEVVLANKMDQPWTEDVQVVGRQCESGDLIVDGAPMPEAEVGDLVVATTTGAYGYTMANNYNGAFKPAMVFVSEGQARLVVRRETYDDLLATQEPEA